MHPDFVIKLRDHEQITQPLRATGTQGMIPLTLGAWLMVNGSSLSRVVVAVVLIIINSYQNNTLVS